METTRRGFLGAIGAILAGRLAGIEPHGKLTRCVLTECRIAGFRYHDGPEIIRYLHAGDEVQLTPEPENPHDPWAVRIEHNRSRLGYLPRTHNEAVSRLLQQDAPVRCTITRVDPHAPPWEAVDVQASVELPKAATVDLNA